MPIFRTPPGRPFLLVLIVLALGLTGCASRQSHQKAVALAAKFSGRKAAPAAKAKFAQLRSVTLLAGREIRAANDARSITINGLSEGQAACISKDGYLLTAGHVVDSGTVFVFLPRPGLAGGWWKADPLPGGEYVLTDRTGQTRPATKNEVIVRRIRVAHFFREADVALVHLDGFRPPAFFEVADASPPAETTIWAHCAPSNGPPPCVSGRVFGPVKSRLASFFVFAESGTRDVPATRTAESWRLMTDVVVQCGDSGGAGFDDRGRLVGVSSTGAITPGILGRPRALWSAYDGIAAPRVRAAMEADRAKRKARVISPAKASSARPSAS